ncbi:MAG: hypothetical protein QM681_04785 [Novosphingobium sp.]
MTMLFILLAAGVVSQTDVNVPNLRQCDFEVEQASGRDGPQKFEAQGYAPMMLSAIEKRVNGCSLLTEAGTGRTMEAPGISKGPAKLKPAH